MAEDDGKKYGCIDELSAVELPFLCSELLFTVILKKIVCRAEDEENNYICESSSSAPWILWLSESKQTRILLILSAARKKNIPPKILCITDERRSKVMDHCWDEDVDE
ncbi:hypothetical protein ACFE04_023990 [Oxalis oulophora]